MKPCSPSLDEKIVFSRENQVFFEVSPGCFSAGIGMKNANVYDMYEAGLTK